MHLRSILVGLMFLLLPLGFLLGQERSTLHFMRVINSLMPNKVELEYVSGEAPLLKAHEIFLQHRATRWTSDKAFHGYLTSPDVGCNDTYRAGNQGDGGWDVCVSGQYLLKPPCLVYSFGINYDFSFDDAISGKYNCSVKSYDPSMNKIKNHKRGENINFVKEGISGYDFKDGHGWNIYSFSTILKKQNDENRIIDYLKMDVEWSEWETIPDMAVKGLFKNIKQIGLEIHRHKSSTKSVHLINILEDNGFRKWKMHYNMACGYKMKDGTATSQCLELYYINMNFLDSA